MAINDRSANVTYAPQNVTTGHPTTLLHDARGARHLRRESTDNVGNF
jgi:hypothetical protein